MTKIGEKGKLKEEDKKKKEEENKETPKIRVKTEKKSTFSKEKELKKKLSEKERELIEFNDRYLRLAADFDNYRKRTEKEFREIIEYAGEGVLRQVLPILDDIERALFNNDKNISEESVQKGLELIHKKFVKTLEDLGVKPIESLNKPFDPDFHHAVLAREEKGIEPEMVVEEFEKGYVYKKQVLRYAKVVVSK